MPNIFLIKISGEDQNRIIQGSHNYLKTNEWVYYHRTSTDESPLSTRRGVELWKHLLKGMLTP